MRVAIVGTGYIASRHAAVLSTMPAIKLAGFVDVVPGAAEKAARQWGGKAYDQLEALLQSQPVDAVWICVPPFAHGAIERACIERGVPMYIEKPVDTGVLQPRKLSRAITNAKLVVNVGFYWRCMQVLPRLRQLLAETPPYLVRIAYHGPTAPATWWRQEAKSGGQVIEQATHLLDTARYLLGEPILLQAAASYRQRPEYPDMDIATATSAILQFPSVTANFTACCVLDSFVDTALEFLCEGRKITLSLKELVIDAVDGRKRESTGEDPLVLADQAFIAAVQASDPTAVPCSYSEALRTQQLCYDITQAAQTRTRHD